MSRLLLESSATDGFLLEDGSGVLLLELNDPVCVIDPSGGFFWLFEDGSTMALEDCTGGWLLEDQSGAPEPEPDAEQRPTGGWHPPRDNYERRVRAHWDRIDALEQQQRDRAEEQVERQRERETVQAQINDLAVKKRQTKTLQARRDKLAEKIARYEAETATMRVAVEAMAAEIERIRALIAAELEAASRRRMMMLALLLASS